jgi:hypothetical protein
METRPLGLGGNPAPYLSLKRELQNSIRSQIRAFFVGFGFLAKRLWPIGYVALRKTEPTKKSSNLTREASFAIPSKDWEDFPPSVELLPLISALKLSCLQAFFCYTLLIKTSKKFAK